MRFAIVCLALVGAAGTVRGGLAAGSGGWKVQKTVGTEATVGEDGKVTIRRTDLAAENAYGLVASKPVAVVPGYAYEFGMTCRGTSLLRPDSSFRHGAYAYLDVFPLDAHRKLVKSDRTQGTSRLSTYSPSPDFRTYEGVFRMPRTDGELSAQLRLQLSDGRKDNPSVAEFTDAWIRPADFELSNPGFEDGADAPEDWAPFGAAKCARTDAERHGGRFAVTVADAPDGELSGWSRLVPVRADRTYSLSGWVKGGDLNPDGHVGGGALAVSFLDADRNTVGETSVSTAVPARTDWTRVELKDVRPPRGAVLMRITAGLRYCRGQAWFDDLDLTMREVRSEKVAEVVRDPKPSPSVRYAKNLLANGDCEAGTDGKPAHWHYVGKAEKDWTEAEIAEFIGQGRPQYAVGRGRGIWSSDVAYAGAHALANVSIDPPLASGGWHGRNPVAGCWVSDPMPCAPGKAYVAGCWIRPGRLINDSWYGPLRLVFRDAKGRVLAPANRDIRAMMEACEPGVWSVWWTAPYVAPKAAATVELEFGQEYNALRGGWGTTYADNLAVWEFAGDIATIPSMRNRAAFPEWFLTTPSEKPPYLAAPRRADEYVSVRGEGANTATANAFYDPSKPVELSARLFNLLGEDRDLTIEMTRYDEKGREYPAVTSSVALEGYGRGTARMTVPPAGDYGCFFVDCRIREGEATVGAFSMRYAVMPRATRRWTVENPLTVTLLAEPSDELLACAKAGGFGSLWLHPNGLLGAESASDFATFDAATAPIDRDIALCEKWGLKVIFGIPPKDFFREKHPRTVDYAAAKRLGSFLGRKYADRVRVFVNWGVEQANSKSGYRGGVGSRVTDEEYDTLMASIYDGIKSAAPQAKVVIGNIATDFNADTVRRMYEGPGRGKFDGAAFNAYMGFGTCMSNMLKVFDEHGDTSFELWSEEQCAQRSPIDGAARRYGELEGAENLVRTWIENLAMSRGRLRSITQWGFLRTGATAPDVYMMDRFCQPRPHFVAHVVMADFLADVVFTADRGRGRTVAFEGRRTGGATVVAAWTVSGKTVLRYRSARAARVTDPMGRVREIAPGADGTVAVPLTHAPLLVDFGGAAEFAGTEEGDFAGVSIARAAGHPAMDGTWTGWNGEPDIAVDETSGQRCVKEGWGTEAWTGRADASGAFKLVWDDENLYFGMAVTDDVSVPQKADATSYMGPNGFMGDSIEFAVQPEGILKESAPHFEWEVFLPDGFTRPVVNRRFPLPGLANDTNLVASVTRAAKGGDCAYQLAIPWKLLGVTPRAGHPITLALTLNDKDDRAVVFSGKRVQLNWADGLGAKNPSRYGECRLADVGVVSAETFESRGFGRLEVGFEELGGGATKTTFTAETPELAARTAAKRRVDLLSYGDLKEVAPNVLQLAGTGCWTLSVSGKVFTETFDPKAAHSQSPNPPIKQSNNSPYPAWMDAFDRYGTTIWLGGGGTGYRPDDFEWLKKMDFGFCASMTGEDIYFAPGEFDSTLYDWYEAMSRKYGLPWRLLSAGHTTWYWNNRPLPYVQPYDERFVGNSGFYYQNDQISGDGSRPIAGAGYVPFHHDFYATSTAALRDSNAMGWQASPEVPNGNINWLAACAKTPGVVRYWHQWLREVEGRSLADLGRRYFGDAAHYASWDDVAVPVPLDFLGHDPARDIDLFGEWEMTASTNAPNWTKGMCNDAAIFIHRGGWATHTHADLGEFFLRRTFTVPEEKLASSRYLHLATAAFSAHYTPYPDVWVNGVRVPSVEQRSVKKLTSDWAHCFDVGAALRPGENTILVNTLGNPIPGFAFLNGTRLRHYPHLATEGMNLRWYDACNFGSWLRTRAIVERARAFRAADRERPLKLMAIHSAQDMIIDLCRKYGMYQHDTGGSGAFWGPYTGSFLGRSHGLAWSCEQAGPPRNAREVQHQMSLYLNYGNDAVDAVFAVAHYTGKPDVKAWCEENSELLHTFGKLHQPRQELAILRSSRCRRQGLESPLNWDIGRGTLQAIGRSFVYLEIPDLHDDALIGAYPVVWDCSTELLLPEDAKAIRRYAERGGTFIALHSTGRHLPERADAWPLAAEFGLTIKDKMLKPGENMHRQPLGPITFAKDQDLFPALAGRTISGSGVAIDCTGREHTGGIGICGRAVPVATWDDDGTMAVAEVKVGRGRVIFLGSTFMTRSRDERGVWMSRGAMNAHLDTMLTRCGVPRRSVTSDRSFWATPWESKNGVYDVYMTTRLQGNGDGKLTNAVYSASFVRPDRIRTVRNMGVKGHPEVPVAWKDGAFALPDDVYEPMQTRVFAAPRADAGRAALRWIRNWCEIWHPLNLKDEETPAAIPRDPNVIALRDGWEGGVAPALWGTLGLEDTAKRTFRTTVKVPEEWRGSRIDLVAVCGRVQRGFYPYGEIKVNGEGLPGLCPFRGMQGAFSVDVTDAAKTGSFTLEVMVDGSICKGTRSRPTGAGATFALRRWPTRRGEKVLEGPWYACEDLDRKTEIKVGDRVKHTYFETTFEVPPEAKGARIFLSSPVPLRGLILNNRMMNAEETMKDLDVTGLVRTDGPNLLRRACADLKGFYEGGRDGMVRHPTTDPLPPMKLWWTEK